MTQPRRSLQVESESVSCVPPSVSWGQCLLILITVRPVSAVCGARPSSADHNSQCNSLHTPLHSTLCSLLATLRGSGLVTLQSPDSDLSLLQIVTREGSQLPGHSAAGAGADSAATGERDWPLAA